MSKSSRGTPFWGKPKEKVLAPGDVFPDIAFTTASHPLQLVVKADVSPKAGERAGRFNLQDVPQITPEIHKSIESELVASKARASYAMLLTWGSDIDRDLEAIKEKGKPGPRAWLAAAVYDLSAMQEK